MKISKIVVTCVDYGDSCDGKARVLLITNKMEEAKNYVINDIKDYIDNNTSDDGECPFIADFDKMCVTGSISSDFGCEWNIETITHEIPDEFKKYLEDYLRLLDCDYDNILELLESDPKRIERVKLIDRISELLK